MTCVSVQAQYVWLPQATGFTPVSSGVRYVSPVDTNILWICSYDGSGGGLNRQDYSMTTDGGNLWTASTIPAPANHDWSMIQGLNADTAFALLYNAVLGGRGGLWRTHDGGTSWAQLDSGVIFWALTSFPDVVHFWNDSAGFLMGDPNPTEFEIYTTIDGGDTWTRVDTANIPQPLTGEYGIVGHFNVKGDTVWFDTNKGRVYRSIDKGYNWTVSSTGITIPANSAMDICFWDNMNGLARLYDGTTGANTMVTTNDGGDTWTTATPTGNFFGSDVKYIPGTPSRLISTGAATGLIGTSFSEDGGLNWTTLETSAQRTALGVVDSLHIWTGGFTVSPTAEGIFKLSYITPVSCTDANINPGTATVDNDTICGGETATFTATGVYAPTTGAYYGVSWIISSADISGSSDPLAEPSLVATYTFTSPAPSTSVRTLTNDGALIDGTLVPYGQYFWTPVVFGNATGTNPVFLSDLTLDGNCLFTGSSIPCWVLDPNSLECGGVGMDELAAAQFSLTAYQKNGDNLGLRIHAKNGGTMSLQIYDVTGRIVSSSEIQVNTGQSYQEIGATGLSGGTYIIRGTLNGLSSVAKVVKL